jgi:hypothetical protein
MPRGNKGSGPGGDAAARARNVSVAATTTTGGNGGACTAVESGSPIALENAPGLVTQPLKLKCDRLVSKLRWFQTGQLACANSRAATARRVRRSR